MISSRKFDRRFFQLYIASFPFLNALSPTTWLPLPTLIAFLSLLYYAIDGRLWRYFRLEEDDLLLAAVFLLGAIGIITHIYFAGQSNLNHIIWYLLTFMLPLAWVRGWLTLARMTPSQIGVGAMMGLLIASGAVITECITSNFFGFYLNEVIPYASPPEDMINANTLEDLWRPRGLAAEPGFTAMVMEALGPLSWLYLRDHRRLAWIVAPIGGLGFLLCASAGGWMCIILAATVLTLLRGRVGKGVIFLLVLVVVFIVSISISTDAYWVYQQVLGNKLENLLWGSSADVPTSGTQRDIIYSFAADTVRNYPFGLGWGMVAQMFNTGNHFANLPATYGRGMVSLYLEIIVCAGIPGLALFIIFIFRKLTVLFRMTRSPDTTVILFSFLALLFHHSIVLEFWYPMLWFMIAMTSYLFKTQASMQPSGIFYPSNAAVGPSSRGHE